jgi:undecaprenyl-diphosphatase
MDYLSAAVFGIVQGLTEFLPVSSSGHLVILHGMLEIPTGSEMLFDVVLHFATLLAVMWFFRSDIARIVMAVVGGGEGMEEDARMGRYIIYATFPAALAGAALSDHIENSLRSPLVVAVMLVAVGVLFIVAERARPGEDTPEDLSLGRALFVGFAQAVALVPGTSRSGITIVAGMAARLSREGAIRFSFLLSIPIILGATLTKVPAVLAEGLSAREHSVLAVAFVFALVSGVLAIRFLLRFAARHTLVPFAWYRFALAAAVLLYHAAASG